MIDYIILKFNKIPIPLFLTLVLVVIVYSNIFQNDFAFDDSTFITGWTTIQSWDNIPRLLAGSVPLGHGGLYRPIRSIFYLLSYHLWGSNTFGYHLQSLLIIIVLTTLVYSITKLITKNNYIAIFSALIFGLHPIHTESITFITASFDSMGIIFFFLSFYLYVYRTKSSHSKFYYSLSLLSATIAYFSYESVLVLPFLLLTYDLFYQKIKLKFNIRYLVSNLIIYLPYLLVGIFYFFLRIIMLGIVARGEYILGNPYFTFLLQVQAISKYIQLLILPKDLTVNHLIAPGIFAFTWAEINKQAILSLQLISFPILLPIIITGLSLLVIIICYQKWPLLSFGLAWFFITLIPVLNIIPQGSVMTERYLLIPSFGFSILMAIFFSKLLKYQLLGVKLILSLILVLVLVFYCWQTYHRNSEWRNSETLWQSAYNLNSDSFTNCTNLAVAYDKRGNHDEALKLLLKAQIISPDNFHSYQNLGVHFFKIENYDLAILYYKQSMNLQPDPTYIFSALSAAYQAQKKYDLALDASLKAVEKSYGGDSMAFSHLGEVYEKLQQYDKAVAAYYNALKINPENPHFYHQIAYIYHLQGKYDLAVKKFTEAIAYNPNSAELHYNLGISLEALGKPDLALQEYSKSLNINPNSADVHNNLGIVYTGYNKYIEAEGEFKKALELNPKLAEAYFNLAYIYKKEGKIDLAKIQVNKGLLIDPSNKKAMSLLN